MRILTDSGIWKKIVIVFLLISSFNFIAPESVQAVGDSTGLGGELMGNILALFAGVCDGVMTLVHKIFTGTDAVVYTITAGVNWWHVLALVGVVVVGVALLLTGWWSIPALILKGALVVTMLTAVGATTVAFATTSGILKDWLADETLVLTTFSLTPYEIFSNRDEMLSVNFFEEAKTTSKKQKKANEKYNFVENLMGHNDLESKYGTTISEIETGEHETKPVEKSNNFQGGLEGTIKTDIYTKEKTIDGEKYKFVMTRETTTVKGNSVSYVSTKVYKYGVPGGEQTEADTNNRATMIQALRDVIGNWYVTLRLIALVGMMSVLVYIGIKIMISSAASTKAKYKQLLMDWFVAMLLLFIMHYIMVFLNLTVDKFTEMIDTIRVEENANMDIDGDGKEETVTQVRQDGVECFMIGLTTDDEGELKIDDDSKDLVEGAYECLVGDNEENNKFKNYFYKSTTELAESKSEAKILMWPAENFTVQARIKAQLVKNEDGVTYEYIGYTLVYIMLVVYTVVFLVVYIKRLIYMAFLTMISPLVALSYPIDKIKDGSAQGFNFWFKEYLFNLLLQPLHLLLYMVLIGSAMQLASTNVIYVIVALGFMVPAEKLVRQMFGFGGSTPGSMPGVAAGAMMMNFTKRMFDKTPKGNAPDKGNAGDSTTTSTAKIKTYNPYGNSNMYNNIPPAGGGGNPPTGGGPVPPVGGGNPPTGGGPVPPVGGGNPPTGGGPVPPVGGGNPPTGGAPVPPVGGGNPPTGGGPVPPVGGNPPIGGGPVPPVGGGNPPTGGGPVPPVGGGNPPIGGGPVPPVGGGNPPMGGQPVPPVGGGNPPMGGQPVPPVGGGNPPTGGQPVPPVGGGSPPTGGRLGALPRPGGPTPRRGANRQGRPSRKTKILNAAKSVALGSGRRFVRSLPGALKTGAGIGIGALGATVGIAAGGIAGMATGDGSKGFEYMSLGAASGYKLGNKVSDNIADGIIGTPDRVRNSYTAELARSGYYAGDPQGLVLANMKKESKKWRNDENNIRKLQNNLTKDQYKSLMKKDTNGNRGIDKYIYQGFTDVNDIIASEKFIEANGWNNNPARSAQARDDAIDVLAMQKQVGKIDDMKLDDQIKWENTMAKEFANAMGITDTNDPTVRDNVRLARQNLTQFEKQRDNIV